MEQVLIKMSHFLLNLKKKVPAIPSYKHTAACIFIGH